MRRLLQKVLPKSVRRFLANAGGTYLRVSYSQEGEDLILDRALGDKRTGFYVDVGAHHPRRFSNTYRFYKRGWRGINIEPNPAALRLFQQARKRDINLGFGVAETEDVLPYYMFNESALNSFDRSISENRQNSQYKIVGVATIAVRRLAGILEEFVPPQVDIDFMSIDVEGYDLQVLSSNDWSRFRPIYLLVECLDFDLGDPSKHAIHNFLHSQRYELFAKTFNTLFYCDQAPRAAGKEGTVSQ